MSCQNNLKIERLLRGIAGVFLILSIILMKTHNPNWIWFTGFIALNLLQSSFTNWCPMMTILRKLNVEKER